MYTVSSKRQVYHKLISLVTASFFFLNVFTADVLALAPESRLNPFFERHGLDFKNTATVMLAAGQLRNMIATGDARQGNIMRLNQLFTGGEVEIEKDIRQGNFKCSGRTYDYAVFHFKKENKAINALFIKDYDKLTEDELIELGVKTDEDKRYFNSVEHPVLRGVWFVNPEVTSQDQAGASGKPIYVLGVVRNFHDSAAVLVKDGRVIGAIEEERCVRDKHTSRFFPDGSVLYLLQAHGIGWEDITHIAVNYDYNFFVDTPSMSALFDDFYRRIGEPPLEGDKERYSPERLKNHLVRFAQQFNSTYVPPITFVNHHKSHAASGLFTSPFADKTTLIVVVDGKGENDTVTIWLGENGQLTKVDTAAFHPDSLGRLYHVTSKYLGYSIFDEGKVMGLSPFGAPQTHEEEARVDALQALFDELILFDHQSGKLKIHRPYRNFAVAQYNSMNFTPLFLEKLRLLVPPLADGQGGEKLDPKNPAHRPYVNLAYVLQRNTEKAILNIVRYYLHQDARTSKAAHLIMAGGVGLNVAANGRILSEGLVAPDKFYVPAFPADDGTPIGAALTVAREEYGLNVFHEFRHVSLGRMYTDEEIKMALDTYGLREGVDYVKVGDTFSLTETTARYLSNGKTVAWFQGGSEFGPRALGNRSILHAVNDPTGNLKMNEIKGREWWRPLAMSIIEEAAGDYLENIFTAQFMTVAYKVRAEREQNIVSGRHPAPNDATTRPQTVSKREQPLFWGLLHRVGELTGIPALINTSFNRGEPIVETPQEALDTFIYAQGIDYLVMGQFIIKSLPQTSASILSIKMEEDLNPFFEDKEWTRLWEGLERRAVSGPAHLHRLTLMVNGKPVMVIPVVRELFWKKTRGTLIQALVSEVKRRSSNKSGDFTLGLSATAYEWVIRANFRDYIDVPDNTQAAGPDTTSITVAQAEVDTIHIENLNYTPTIPDKTILCHIVTDSILPVQQRDMLKTLEQEMRHEKYGEKVVSLSVADSAKPEEFMTKLEALKTQIESQYKGYNVQFDVACPKKELVENIQKLGIQALAFTKEGGGDIVQVESIMMALRALETGDMNKLLGVYRSITGKDYTKKAADIYELARSLLFTLPARKVDVNEIGTINRLIEENIKKAA